MSIHFQPTWIVEFYQSSYYILILLLHDVKFCYKIVPLHSITLSGDTSEEPPIINPETGQVETRTDKTTPAKMSPFKHSPQRHTLFKKPDTPERKLELVDTSDPLPTSEGRMLAKANLLSELIADDDDKENTESVGATDALDISDTSDVTPRTG